MAEVNNIFFKIYKYLPNLKLTTVFFKGFYRFFNQLDFF